MEHLKAKTVRIEQSITRLMTVMERARIYQEIVGESFDHLSNMLEKPNVGKALTEKFMKKVPNFMNYYADISDGSKRLSIEHLFAVPPRK